MGKRKRKRTKYTKKEFITIVCDNCAICGDYVDPTFCFDVCYKDTPKVFMKGPYYKLTSLTNDWPYTTSGVSSLKALKKETKLFKTIFCKTKCKQKSKKLNEKKYCEWLSTCIEEFRCQVLDSFKEISNKKKTKKKINKNKNKKIVVTPYATFFSSNNKEFRNEIKRILNETNDNQQARVEGVP